jgi:ADP-heptose:LPS heptosyltransferase
MKILLIRLDHLGDLVLTTPLIRALAKAGHSVDVVTRRGLLPILEGNPHVNEALAVEAIAPGFPKEWRPLRDWMKARAYDAVLLPNPRPRQLLWCSLGSGARHRVALQGGLLGRLLRHRCISTRESYRQGRHFSDLQLDLARALGVSPDGLEPDYFCREDEVEAAREKIKALFPGFNGEPIVGIHPGCMGNTCNLPSTVYGEIATLILQRTNWRVIVTGSTQELPLLDSWPQETVSSKRLANGMGVFDLRALAAIITRLSNYVVVGTGPLHLASALRVRTTSPFCAVPPLAPTVWGPATNCGTCLMPGATGCREWIAKFGPHHHCDFRGEITAEDFFTRLQETTPAS